MDEKFQKAFTFLRRTDLEALTPDRVPIDGDEVYANVQEYTTMPPEACPFESHRQYFDLQFVVLGCERMGYAPVSALTPAMDYDPARDLVFYEEPAAAGDVLLGPGDFAIVAPEDGHRPRRMANGPCKVKKIVVKVKV